MNRKEYTLKYAPDGMIHRYAVIMRSERWTPAFSTNSTARISQRLTARLKELMERHETLLPEIDKELAVLEEKVNGHLKKMGFVW